jgi:hypothetical protein
MQLKWILITIAGKNCYKQSSTWKMYGQSIRIRLAKKVMENKVSHWSKEFKNI